MPYDRDKLAEKLAANANGTVVCNSRRKALSATARAGSPELDLE